MTVPRSLLRLGWAAHRFVWRASGGRLGRQFEEYQRRSERPLPIVVLEPRPARRPS